MSATTPPKRESKNHSGGGHRRRPYVWYLLGGVVFATAWYVWTFWLGGALVG